MDPDSCLVMSLYGRGSDRGELISPSRIHSLEIAEVEYGHLDILVLTRLNMSPACFGDLVRPKNPVKNIRDVAIRSDVLVIEVMSSQESLSNHSFVCTFSEPDMHD